MNGQGGYLVPRADPTLRAGRPFGGASARRRSHGRTRRDRVTTDVTGCMFTANEHVLDLDGWSRRERAGQQASDDRSAAWIQHATGG
jgi:hypothetical protein